MHSDDYYDKSYIRKMVAYYTPIFEREREPSKDWRTEKSISTIDELKQKVGVS